MNNSPFLSIILPTYNRKYCISRMIDSVLMQSFSDFELIIIDDGSTDGTFEMLEEKYQDRRIRLTRQENGGVSSARNLGISLAKGEYITFVDSDDYLLDGFFEDMFEKIQQLQCDVLVYGGYSLENGKQVEVPLFWKDRNYGKNEVTVSSGDDFVKDFCLFGGNSWGCAKVFRRLLIEKNKINFCVEIAYGEDMLFDLQAYLVASQVATSPEKFYICDISAISLSRGVLNTTKKIIDLLNAYQRLENCKDYKAYFAYNYLSHLKKWIFLYIFFLDQEKKQQIKMMYASTSLLKLHRVEEIEFKLAQQSSLYIVLYLFCVGVAYKIYSKTSFLHPIVRMLKKQFFASRCK